MSDVFQPLLTFLGHHEAALLLLAASAIGSGCGAWFGARTIFLSESSRRERDALAATNTAIAALIALLGKLINFKKDLALPARTEAEALSEVIDGASREGAEKDKISVKLELWPEVPLSLGLQSERQFEWTAKELDVIQLVKMLECNLAELAHFVARRNELIRQMNRHQAARGHLPVDGLRLYVRYTAEIARNTEENLFFIDKSIEKIRAAAAKLLPRRLHGGIADVGLRPETQPLMPQKDLIKGWVK